MVKIFRIEQNPQKSQNFHPLKLLRYTVYSCWDAIHMSTVRLIILGIFSFAWSFCLVWWTLKETRELSLYHLQLLKLKECGTQAIYMVTVAMPGLSFMLIQNFIMSVTWIVRMHCNLCSENFLDHDNVCTTEESCRLWNNCIFTASWNGTVYS